MKTIQKGKLLQFHGGWSSGLGSLSIELESGNIINVSCENAPTVRALEDCFGNVITEGHTATGNGYKNQEVYFFIDGIGILEGFTPVDDASPELIEEYEKENDK